MNKFLFLLFMVTSLFASVSTQTLSFQGKLLDNTGAAVTGTRAMTFTLYPQATGGTAVSNATWSQSVSVQNGIYSAELDASAVDLSNVNDAWIEVSVAGEILSPRIHLTSSAFVLKAATATNVVGGVVSANIVTANNLYLSGAPIIAQGGDATGQYVKYADGTMICYGKQLLTSTLGLSSNPGDSYHVYDSSGDFSLPAAVSFKDSNYIIVVNLHIGTNNYIGHAGAIATSPSTIFFREHWNYNYSAFTRTLEWMAIGRWK